MTVRLVINLAMFWLAVVIAFMLVARSFTSLHDPSKCQTFLNNGRWLQNPDSNPNSSRWQPIGCLMHTYNAHDILHCLNNRTLYFTGDSTARELFWATARKLEQERAEKANLGATKHTDLSYVVGNTSLLFHWDPFLNSTATTAFPEVPFDFASNTSNWQGVVASFGLWHARYLGQRYLEEFEEALRYLLNFSQYQARVNTVVELQIPLPLIFNPPPLPAFNLLSPDRALTLTRDRMINIIDRLRAFQKQNPLEVAWSNFLMTYNHPITFLDSGIHVDSHIASLQVDIILNRICNQALYEQGHTFKATCCVVSSNSKAAPPLLIIMLVLSLFLGWYVHQWSLPKVSGNISSDWPLHLLAKWNHSQQVCQVITSHASSKSEWSRKYWKLEKSLGPAVFGLALALCYVAGRTRFLEVAAKPVSTTAFMWTTVLSLVLGAIGLRTVGDVSGSSSTTSSISDDCFLSRPQTEEWKGWMQLVILLYHYFGMSQTLWVYKIVRVLVGSYLFLTGYGHACYFLRTDDFSMKRVGAVLLRLNILTCPLSLIMGNSYDFYYFPGLVSLWFIIIHLTLWTCRKDVSTFGTILVRVILSSCAITAVLRIPGVLEIAFGLLQDLGGPKIATKEFRFRMSLDMYGPFVGILFATFQLRFKRNLPFEGAQDFFRKWKIIIAIVILLGYFIAVQLFASKVVYNRWHPYISPLPILAFVVVRNSTGQGRRLYSANFAWIGRCSLETFVLQYHLWLAADTKGVLRVGLIDRPKYSSSTTLSSWTFWAEAVLIFLFFLWFSGVTAEACTNLTASIMFMNNNIIACLNSRAKQTIVRGLHPRAV